MKKNIAILSSVLAAGICFADFTQDFKKAERDLDLGKNKEAAVQFEKLAAQAPAGAKDQCRFMQTWAFAKMRQFDNAQKAVAEIKDPEMKQCGDFFAIYYCKPANELIAKYGTSDLGKFPEEYQRYVYIFRGERQTDAKKAVPDFEKGVKLSSGDVIRKLQGLNGLTRSYNAAGRKAEAKATAEQAMAVKGYSGFYHTICAALIKARIEFEEGNIAAAEKTLNAIKLGHFAKLPQGIDYCELRGDIAAKKGNAAEAQKNYQLAIDNKYTGKGQKAKLEKKMNALK